MDRLFNTCSFLIFIGRVSSLSEKTFTYGQCYELLDVDAKTFRRWLEKAEFDASSQVSKADNRVKFLLESQVKTLADDHGRPWPPRPAAPVDPNSTTIKRSEFKLLDDKTRQQGADIGELDEQVEQHTRLLTDALLRIEKLERAMAATTEQHTAMALAAAKAATTIKELQEQVADQDDQIEELERQVKIHAEQISELTENGKRGPGKGKGKAQAHEDGIEDLPAHLVHVATFAELHGINPSTAIKAVQSTRLPAARGKWHHGRSVIRVALNGDGRAAFYEQYSTAQGFKACPDCPHEAHQAQAEQEA
jgi:chaperonin cofactor prefoldin